MTFGIGAKKLSAIPAENIARATIKAVGILKMPRPVTLPE